MKRTKLLVILVILALAAALPMVASAGFSLSGL
jgi:hypothetical protein